MADPAVLWVIFNDDGIDSRKLHLPSGFPETVKGLALHEDFRLQYMDFNEFMNLTAMSEIKNKGTLRVIYMSLTLPVEPYITLYPAEPDEATFSTSPKCSKLFISSLIKQH